MPVLAIDVGTSAVKAAVVAPETGEFKGPLVREYFPLESPTPEQAVVDPERLWQAVLHAGRAAAGASAVEGLGLSVFTPGLVLLDEQQKPLTPIITHFDRRSRPTARQVQAERGTEFLASTGNRPLPGGISVITFRHLANFYPDLPRQVRHYLHVNGWLGLRLTGAAALDPGNAGFTGLTELSAPRNWSPRWCAYFGVSADWLPPILPGDRTLGPLCPDVAAEFGLPAGLPVKVGLADTSAAVLAVQPQPGDLLHVVGTTQVLATLTKVPQPSPARLTRPLGVDDWFLHVAHNPVGGVAVDWLRRLCFADQSDEVFYQQTLKAAADRQTSVVLAPPYLGGDRLEIEPRSAGFQNLSLTTDRVDLLSALLAALRQGHRQALTSLDLPQSPKRVYLSGRGAEWVRWLLPEYASSTVHMLEEGSLRGAARLFAGASAD